MVHACDPIIRDAVGRICIGMKVVSAKRRMGRRAFERMGGWKGLGGGWCWSAGLGVYRGVRRFDKQSRECRRITTHTHTHALVYIHVRQHEGRFGI